MDSMTHPLARQLVVALAVCLHLLGNAAALPLFIPILFRLLGQESGLPGAVHIGVLLGQTSLLAAYLAWGSERWFVRWSASCLLALLVWYATATGAAVSGGSSMPQQLAIFIAMSFLFASVACWAVGARLGSRISAIPNDRVPERDLQSLLPLPAVAVGAIVMLGAMLVSRLGRQIWARDWSDSSDKGLVIALWAAIWAGLSLLVAIPAAWSCFGEERPASRLLGIASFVAIVVALESAVLYGASGDARFGVLPIGLNLGVLCEVVGCTLLFRACGCRLHLRGPRSPA